MRRTISLLALACTLLSTGACQRDAAMSTSDPESTPAPAMTDDPAPRPLPGPATGRAPAIVDDANAPLAPSVTMPSADADTPMIAEGATVTYGCDDGNLVVAYGNGIARMTLPDGSRSEARLSVEASARAGGEVYVGKDVGLQRLASAVEVQGADHSVRRCVEASSDA